MSMVRVGTRGSALATRQTSIVVGRLRALHPSHVFVIEPITTRGDILADVPLSSISGQGVFVDALETALRDGRIDLAVHSAKDLPSRLDAAFLLGAILDRADPRDACVSRAGPLSGLPAGARVGTSSARRACQLRARRPDLVLVEMRGNVDTRLRRLDEGRCDALVLAAAGLRRLGLEARVTEYFDPLEVLPCPGQGALAVEIRAGDAATAGLVAPLAHRTSTVAVEAERAFLARLGAGCTAPVGAWARLIRPGRVALDAFIGATDGRMIRGSREGSTARAAALGVELADDLLARGAGEFLRDSPMNAAPRHA